MAIKYIKKSDMIHVIEKLECLACALLTMSTGTLLSR